MCLLSIYSDLDEKSTVLSSVCVWEWGMRPMSCDCEVLPVPSDLFSAMLCAPRRLILQLEHGASLASGFWLCWVKESPSRRSEGRRRQAGCLFPVFLNTHPGLEVIVSSSYGHCSVCGSSSCWILITLPCPSSSGLEGITAPTVMRSWICYHSLLEWLILPALLKKKNNNNKKPTTFIKLSSMKL